MSVAAGTPVVLAVKNGVADSRTFHIADPEKIVSRGNGVTARLKLATQLRVGFPFDWISLCGQPGLLFVYGGSMLRREPCGECAEIRNTIERRKREEDRARVARGASRRRDRGEPGPRELGLVAGGEVLPNVGGGAA